MKNNVFFRQIVNLLEDTDTWLTLLFLALAGFLSYSSWVAPQYRDEMVIATIAAAVANATGVRNVLLAFASSHAVTIGAIANEGINTLEQAVGSNLVPDDLQALGIDYLVKILRELKGKAVTSEEVIAYQKIEREISDRYPARD